MTLVAILGLLLLAVAVAFGIVAVAEPRVRRAEKLGLIDGYGYATPVDSDLSVAPARKTLDGVAAAIGDFLAPHLSSLREAEVPKRLIAAGSFRVGARRFIGYRVLLTLALPLLVIWLFILVGASATSIILLGLIAAALGWFVPGFMLSTQARRRLGSIDNAMPE